MFKGAVVLFCAAVAAWPQATVTTYAGNGNAGYTGDGGPATQATINRVVSLAWDSNGNLYVADQNNNAVRKVDNNGIMTTFAGTGTAGFSGDGGPAAQAELSGPLGVCVDSSNNVFINDYGNLRVRKVTPAGTITTIAGTGASGSSGDGGPATAATFTIPIRCVVDSGDNVYITDQQAMRVRKVTPGGTITTVAGNGSQGFSGDGGPATSASLNNPTALALDSANNLYIVDQFNNRIRKVDASGNINTVVGNGTSTFAGDGGPATSASISFPGSVVLDAAGNMYIVDGTANRIREVSGGIINTIAGTGAAGYGGDGGPALQAEFNGPFAITIDGSGNLYIGDTINNRIRKISNVAGGGGGGAPVLTSTGVTNAASFQTGIAPGAIVTIFGSNLGAAAGQVIAAGATWATSLSGVSVTMDGTAVPVYRVLNVSGQEQLSVLAPFSLAGKNSTVVVVTTPGGSSAPVTVPVLGAQPGIFILDAASDGSVHANGSIVTAASPAAHGETVVLYATGLGTVSNGPQPGQPASSTTLAPANLTPQVTIGGFSAQVSFAGLTPGYIGLYQINVVVPNAAPSGAVDVTVQANNINSNTSKLAIQ
jgi:uncharacterized protein (TIGR03437 family)